MIEARITVRVNDQELRYRQPGTGNASPVTIANAARKVVRNDALRTVSGPQGPLKGLSGSVTVVAEIAIGFRSWETELQIPDAQDAPATALVLLWDASAEVQAKLDKEWAEAFPVSR